MSESPGTVIGNYSLMEQIGEGGMGVVYVAEQQRPVRRRVALKVIKPGMDTKEVISRFAAERQALALMDHPNIAKVYDAGITETGRPFFVMELVRGIPITDYCDLNRLDARERLDLFIDVCHAIQHAHHKGIIHRDLKPSNVLITEHDGTPVVKVIDFGVAKAINQQLTERTIYTRHQQMVGTPMYMSPEQAELSGLDVDTRTDVYSLGVLLYELLTGTTPFDKARFSAASYDEIRRIIREEEPSKPSTKIRTLGKTAASISGYRRTDTRRLTQLLRGDVDWIVMKALEKDRNRRYDTPKGLASDVQRHLNDEPVVARPPSAAYQFQKFSRRHRTLLTSAAAVILALVAGMTIATWKAVEANHARLVAQNAEREQKRSAEYARQQADEARSLAQKEKVAREHSELLAERNHQLNYLSDINLAHHIQRTGDRLRASELLRRYLPRDRESDLRGFEWYYLRNAIGRSAHAVPRKGYVSVAFSPDGSTFVTGGADGVVRLWDGAALAEQRAWNIDSDPRQHYRNMQVYYSPTGKTVAALFRGRVLLFDVASDRSWSLADVSPGSVVQFAFDGSSTVVTAERDGRVRFWNAATGEFSGRSRQLSADATWRQVAFSRDRKMLAAGQQPAASDPVTISVYDLVSGNVLAELEAGDTVLGNLQFSTDNQFLANPGQDAGNVGRLVIWSIATGKEVQSLRGFRSFFDAVPISSGEFAVSGYDFISFVDPGKGEVERWERIPGVVWDLALSSDEATLASTGWDGVVRLWDRPRHENPKRLQLQLRTDALCFSPSGDMLATGHPGHVILRDPLTLEGLQTLYGQRRPVFSPNGDWLATLSGDGSSIHFWEYRTGLPAGSPVTFSDVKIQDVAISNRGDLMGCVGSNNEVFILELPTRRIWKSFDMPASGMKYVTFGSSPEGHDLIAMPADDWTVRLVNLDTGHEQILRGPNSEIYGVAFSPDRQHLASSGDLFVWDLTTGEIEYSVENTTSNLMEVIFAPDGRSMLSRGWVGDMVLWDSRSGRERMRLLEHFRQTVQSFTFSPDGSRIVAGTDLDSLMVWSAPEYGEQLPPARFGVLPRQQFAWGRTRFRVLGPPDRFVIKDLRGDVFVSPTSGTVPGWVDVSTMDPGQARRFSFVVESSDSSQTARVNGVLFGGTDWKVQYYPWKPGQPSGIGENWQAIMRSEAVAEETVSSIEFAWGTGPPKEHVPADYFATVATAELRFTEGYYEFRTVSDDGVRLLLDGEIIIDHWMPHSATLDSAEVYVDSGPHRVRIEHFEISGEAELRFDIVPVEQ
jgi:serine/threonine protein kinase/WD40 repeat protein